MLEKPDIPDTLIISRFQEEYGLRVAKLTFLPIGADLGTAVYRLAAENGTAYFLKLRKGFNEIIVTVPLFLKSQGNEEIIAPIETRSKQGWAAFGEYTMILYPFIEGKDGFERELTDRHRRILGAALNKIHSIQLPLDLKGLIPQERFSSEWREKLRSFQARIENNPYQDSTAARLAMFMKGKQGEIRHLVVRSSELASELQSRALELVLCHTDIHGGNMLISHNDDFYIVDWDNPLLAPKERDLMFIGGGIDGIWKSQRELDIFYKGYGRVEINSTALAYYRYERIVEDLAMICDQLLSTDEGRADREQAFRWFAGNFEPGGTIEIADKTYRQAAIDR